MSDQDEPIDQDDPFDDDLIDRIANFVPAEARAAFYRELRHCRSLPQNDEMLRIIRAMQYLVLIMVKLPEQMAHGTGTVGADRIQVRKTLKRCPRVRRRSDQANRSAPCASIGGHRQGVKPTGSSC